MQSISHSRTALLVCLNARLQGFFALSVAFLNEIYKGLEKDSQDQHKIFLSQAYSSVAVLLQFYTEP